MAADFLGPLDTQIAKALRALDLATTIAEALEHGHPRDELSQRRLAAAVRRVKAIRVALLREGIELPPLRAIWQTDRRYGLGGETEDLQG
jgi:hypothetical protein